MDCSISHELYNLVDVNGVAILLESKCDVEMQTLWFNAVRLPSSLNVAGTYSVKLTPADSPKPCLEIDTKAIDLFADTTIDINLCEKVALATLLKIFKTSNISCHWDISCNE